MWITQSRPGASLTRRAIVIIMASLFSTDWYYSRVLAFLSTMELWALRAWLFCELVKKVPQTLIRSGFFLLREKLQCNLGKTVEQVCPIHVGFCALVSWLHSSWRAFFLCEGGCLCVLFSQWQPIISVRWGKSRLTENELMKFPKRDLIFLQSRRKRESWTKFWRIANKRQSYRTADLGRYLLPWPGKYFPIENSSKTW